MTTPEPPLEAERSVVGLVLAKGAEILDEITLSSDDFSNMDLATIFEAATRLHAAGSPVTRATVTAKVKPALAADIVELSMDYQHDRYALQQHAQLVARYGLYTRLVEVGHTFAEGMKDLDEPGDMMEYARRVVDQSEGRPSTKLRFVRDIIPDAIAAMRAETTFVPTPWQGLNDIIGGLRPGNLVVVAARPAVGKSVVANALALTLAQHGHVAYSSLEMSEQEVVQRLLADQADVNIGRMKDNRLDAEDIARIRETAGHLHMPLAINDQAAIGPSELRSWVRTVSRAGKLSGIVVDYVQLMSTKSKSSRQEQVADFSRQLKLLGKEYQVPVIALSQLNRESEGQMGRARPKMSQLRESGAIEQDADVIILLHREADEDGHLSDTEILMDVTKNRHGRTGFKTFAWNGSRSRITDYAVYTPGPFR